MLRIVFCLFSMIFSTPYLQAQEEETTERSKEDYFVEVEEEAPDSSTTATKLPELIEWTPASVGVIPGSLFNLQDAVVLNDALRNVSGINVLSGNGTFDFFTIRGFDSLSSALVLTDGAPEPESTYYQLYNVDRVEVLKGPGAFLYGGNPLSGTVNLIRKQPIGDTFFRLYNSYGSFASYRGNLDMNYSKPDSNLAFRLNGLWLVSDSYRNNQNNNAVAANPALTWRINSESSLRFNFEYLRNEYQPDSGIPIVNGEIPDVPRDRSYQSQFDNSDQNIYRTRIDYEAKLNDTFVIRDKFYSTVLDWKTDGTLLNGAFPDGFGSAQILRTLTLLDDRQHLTGNQLETVATFATGSVHHTMLGGFEITRLTDKFSLDVALLPSIDLLHPVETATEPLFFIPGQSQVGDARSIVYAPYVVDQMKFSDKILVQLGGRFDVLDFDDAATNTSRNDNKFSPMFGVVYSPISDLSLYFNAGQGFAPPSTTVVGERKPEESTQFEGGLKKQFLEGRVMTTLAIYNLERKNIAIPDANGITRQAGDQRSRGFELELMGSPARSWNAAIAYAFNDSELTSFSEIVFTNFPPFFVVADRTGNTPAFAPRNILNAWVTKTFRNGFGIGGGPRYVSDQFIDEDNEFKIDGYVTFDAVTYYDWNHWRFTVNFKNITDKDYETRGFGPFSVIPASPFAVYGSVDFRL
jgi:TonB-dependent siderophore receptor